MIFKKKEMFYKTDRHNVTAKYGNRTFDRAVLHFEKNDKLVKWRHATRQTSFMKNIMH